MNITRAMSDVCSHCNSSFALVKDVTLVFGNWVAVSCYCGNCGFNELRRVDCTEFDARLTPINIPMSTDIRKIKSDIAKILESDQSGPGFPYPQINDVEYTIDGNYPPGPMKPSFSDPSLISAVSSFLSAGWKVVEDSERGFSVSKPASRVPDVEVVMLQDGTYSVTEFQRDCKDIVGITQNGELQMYLRIRCGIGGPGSLRGLKTS